MIAGVIIGATFERTAENGVRGFVMTVTELDENTGELTTRTVERSFPIPTPATIGFDISIGGQR